MRISGANLVLASLVAGTFFPPSAQQFPSSDVPCTVTTPNGIVAGQSERQESSYGNTALSVDGLWPRGEIVFAPHGSGFVTHDGALGMKFLWIRAVPGNLKISGRRLDADAPPLRSDLRCCYGESGFRPSYLIFPTPGCWEVTGQVGEREDSKLTFVTRVVKIGDGPAWRLDPQRE